jgi:hypothetical protein
MKATYADHTVPRPVEASKVGLRRVRNPRPWRTPLLTPVGALQYYRRSGYCRMTSPNMPLLDLKTDWSDHPTPNGVVWAPWRTMRKGIHLQTQPKDVQLHPPDATLAGKMQVDSPVVKSSKKRPYGLEDDVPRDIVEHRPHRHPFERSGPGFDLKITRNGRRTMVTPPRRRTTPIGTVVTSVGELDEPFGWISPIHHPFFEVQPLSQLRRPDHYKKSFNP